MFSLIMKPSVYVDYVYTLLRTHLVIDHTLDVVFTHSGSTVLSLSET